MHIDDETTDVLIGGYLSTDAAHQDYDAVLHCGARLWGIVVLNKDLPGGALISAADLSTRKMAGDISMDNVITKTSDVDGRVLATNGVKDSPLLSTMLAPKGAQSGLSAVIPEGMRAITIEINEFTGVAGYLQGGCRVDLVATMTADGEMLSRTVAQNIKVQTVGMRPVVVHGGGTAGISNAGKGG